MSWPQRVRARVAPLYEHMQPYDPCHDLYHVDRVARNARRLAAMEGADADVCEAAAYLHDLDRVGAKDNVAAAREHLAALGAPADWSARVLEAVERHKDKSFAPGGKRAMSVEAAVLGDADKLEAIGAIGIARAFSFGGVKGRALWDGAPLVEPEVYVSGKMGTTLQHFPDKLFRLQADFNTKSGRALGEERTTFLHTFVEQFVDEWG